jgi:hypothetical protein
MLPGLTPGQFQAQTGVSRETLARLETYVELLTSWNRRINLVGPNTIGDIWRRHILDSAQLFPLIPPAARRLVDFGSGAGLPGLILAIMGVPEVYLVESDQRKIAFMREGHWHHRHAACQAGRKAGRVPGRRHYRPCAGDCRLPTRSSIWLHRATQHLAVPERATGPRRIDASAQSVEDA